jgi:glycosyltransferase involved in cell wall biosynthesis
MSETVATPAPVVRRAACGTPTGLQALVCQLGAREHYLVARCFAKLGFLSCLATDFWSTARQPKGWLFWQMPKVVLSALARCHPELQGQRVASFPLLAVARYTAGLFDRRGKCDAAIAREFAKRVQAIDVPRNVFFGYSYDSLELLREERKKGVFTILCQTDPGPAHYRMIGKEQERWPQYGRSRRSWWSQERSERLREEWGLADVIVANSEWTRDLIVAEGADASKIEILPLAYGIDANPAFQLSAFSVSASSPLKVLWLGEVALGKGIQYLVEAVRLLAAEQVHFFVGGRIDIASSIIKSGPRNIRWLGQIPRSRTAELYNDCDIFVFPTLSDGFGLTQLEALAHGLPVIATPNCGRVVEDGWTGFIVPPRDPRALADAILRFVRKPTLAREMSPNCLKAAIAFSVGRYGDRLLEIISRRMPHRSISDH